MDHVLEHYLQPFELVLPNRGHIHEQNHPRDKMDIYDETVTEKRAWASSNATKNKECHLELLDVLLKDQISSNTCLPTGGSIDFQCVTIVRGCSECLMVCLPQNQIDMKQCTPQVTMLKVSKCIILPDPHEIML